MNKSLKLKIPSLIDNIRVVESFIDHTREKFNYNDDIFISLTFCKIIKIQFAFFPLPFSVKKVL